MKDLKNSFRGAGLYIRKLQRRVHGTPNGAAKRALEHGLSHVHILVAWQQVSSRGVYTCRRINSFDDALRYAEAFDAVGIRPFVWAYPWVDHEGEFIDILGEYTRSAPFSGVTIDPELGYKVKGARRSNVHSSNMRGVVEAIRSVPTGVSLAQVGARAMYLCEGILDILSEDDDFVVTSYGRPRYHSDFPWPVFCSYGYQSPQFYDFSYNELEAGFSEWEAHMVRSTPAGEMRIVPSIGLYGPRSGAALHGYMLDLIACGRPIPGVIGWSWVQTSKMEWGIIQEFSERFSEGPL